MSTYHEWAFWVFLAFVVVALFAAFAIGASTPCKDCRLRKGQTDE